MSKEHTPHKFPFMFNHIPGWNEIDLQREIAKTLQDPEFLKWFKEWSDNLPPPSGEIYYRKTVFVGDKNEQN